MYDVAVIGGGPVGSYIAYKLAGRGHKVLVLERKNGLGERVCCTGVIGQECADAFAIDGNIVLRQANSAKLFAPSGKSLRLWRPETQVCFVDRPALNMTMGERAQRKGAEYLLGSSVKNVETGGGRVRVEALKGKAELNFEARAVVIATGFGSGLAEKLGLGKIKHFVIGAQAEVETTGIEEAEVYFGRQLTPGFFAWLVPTSPNRALVGLLSRRSPGLYLKKLMSSLLAQGKIVSAKAETSCGGIPLKPLARTYGERLLVVGSAAGQVKPTTGGGIYYGLLCAEIAANNLHQALETNTLSARNLAYYEREWKKKLGRELKIERWARRLYERLSDKQIDKIFDIINSKGLDETLLKADDLSFDWHGEAVLRLLGHRAMFKVLKAMMIPFLYFK